MKTSLRRYWPEIGLLALLLFFGFRELGTFPRAWADEGLFIMVARTLAAEGQYGVRILDELWRYPYFLAIGPTVIVPVALSLKLFGLSVAAARVPMVLYLLVTSAALYFFTKKVRGRSDALWATGLLITLSAFVNTGKPVLGEVPACAFLFLGLLALESRMRPWKRGLLAGLFFALAFLTKVTFGLLLPALFIAWIVALIKRDKQEIVTLTIAGLLSPLLYVPWSILETVSAPAGNIGEEINEFVLGGGSVGMFHFLRTEPEALLRIPFIAFGVFLVLGIIGLYAQRGTMRRSTASVMSALIVFFLLYCLNAYGWYRHLLPAHLLLLPFVPLGARRLLGTKPALIVLGIIVVAQGYWQLDHRGAGRAGALTETVRILEAEYRSESLLVEEPEVYAQLQPNPEWLYVAREGLSPTMPDRFIHPTEPSLRCRRHLRKLNAEEIATYGDQALAIGGYHLIPVPADCPAPSIP